jgi:RNA polymerase sigma-70 factor (ECF subfamily)
MDATLLIADWNGLSLAAPAWRTPSRVIRREHEEMREQESNRSSGAGELRAESTVDLLARARGGDARAFDLLYARYAPRLREWARGRLPLRSRDLLDTEDIVQEVLVRSLKHVASFEPRADGGFHAYLRQAINNRVRDELRRVKREPERTALESNQADAGLSPLEYTIGREQAERYERALARLSPADREAVVARIEMRCSYEEIADALGKPSKNAARMSVIRAIERLVEEMADE